MELVSALPSRYSKNDREQIPESERVAVLADVHGNAVALEAVLEELAGEAIELVVFDGDLTWGPLPQATLALVDALEVPALFVFAATRSARSSSRRTSQRNESAGSRIVTRRSSSRSSAPSRSRSSWTSPA
jgi:hypothetical protein